MYANSDATVLTGQRHLHTSQHPSNRMALVRAYFTEKYEQSKLGDPKRSPLDAAWESTHRNVSASNASNGV